MTEEELELAIDKAGANVSELRGALETYSTFVGVEIGTITISSLQWSSINLLLRHRELLLSAEHIASVKLDRSKIVNAALTEHVKVAYYLAGFFFVIAFFLGFYAGAIR